MLLSTQFPPDDFAQLIVASWQGTDYNYEDINSVSVDSRQIISGRNTLFFALVRASGDGHHYIADAYRAGVRNFVISTPITQYSKLYPDALFWQVCDTLRSLQTLATWHRKRCLGTKILAIIGSNGKTSTKEILYTLLSSSDMLIYRSPGSYNSQIGVALSLLSMPLETDLAIIEAGISHPSEMAYLRDMIQPDETIVTHLGTAHSQNFSSLNKLYEEKAQMLHSPKIQYIYCYTSQEAQTLKEFIPEPSRVLCVYGSKQQSDAERYPLLDATLKQNLSLALYYIARNYPQYYDQALKRSSEISPLPMRMELMEGEGGNILINDSYSNDLDALKQAIIFLRQQGGKDIVLGAIEQSNLSDEALQGEVLKLCLDYAIEKVYLIGWHKPNKLLNHNTAGLPLFTSYSNSEELLHRHKKELLKSKALLIKGARRLRLEELVLQLARKEHDSKLQINLSTLRDNLAFYRALLPQKAKLICMIKADAYGLGAKAIAEVLQYSGHVQYLAVAVLDEAKALRREGIFNPIIVMNPQKGSLKNLCRLGVDAEVYSLPLLRDFAQLKNQGYSTALHLKIDSGMHRLGVTLDDLDDIVAILSTTKLTLSSVFSHLAGADEEALDYLTLEQVEYTKIFHQRLCTKLRELGYDQEELPFLHLLNTAGLERFAHSFTFDGARLGIGLYGFSPTKQNGVQAVAMLTTRILQIKEIAAHSTVGYSGKAYAEKARKIATLPIGYADGLHRRYGNGNWSVQLRGVLCPIIGNICMDACMIDISHLSDVKPGEEVIIFGGNLTPLYAMAEVGGTIPYEVLTSISPRVARIYY